jgi:hypothetical protein
MNRFYHIAGKVALGGVAAWIGVPVLWFIFSWVSNAWTYMFMSWMLSGMPSP